jgi:uncharacterized membrane protein YdbT with pleckstrin-like domain
MNSIDDKLKKDETIIYRAKCHWAVLLGPILIIIIGGLALGSQGYHAMALIAFGLVWGIFSYISLRRSKIELTRSNILINVGFPLKKFYDMPLNEIMSIDFYQPSLGSMLNFGKIIIENKGKKKRAFRFVSCPAEFVKEVQQQIVRNSQSDLLCYCLRG